jgi:hypothetical protein
MAANVGVRKESRQAKSTVAPVAKREVRADTQSKIRPTRVVLDNGMVVIIQENRSNPTIAVQGSLNAGGMLEPQNLPGLAQVTAAMLMKGTTKRLQIKQEGHSRTVDVRIPVGVTDGSRVRVAGEGEQSGGTRAGDLYLRIRLRPPAAWS